MHARVLSTTSDISDQPVAPWIPFLFLCVILRLPRATFLAQHRIVEHVDQPALFFCFCTTWQPGCPQVALHWVLKQWYHCDTITVTEALSVDDCWCPAVAIQLVSSLLVNHAALW